MGRLRPGGATSPGRHLAGVGAPVDEEEAGGNTGEEGVAGEGP